MPATMNRVVCPHCGRAIALRQDTGAISVHGARHRRCPAGSLTHLNGALTERQMLFLRTCYRTGDALPVARFFGIEYPQPDLTGMDLEHAMNSMFTAAQMWIAATINGYQEQSQ